MRSDAEILAELNALDRPVGGAPLRPKDAATLILLDHSAGAVRMLMGRRHRRHRFMPGALVFPGGRVDPEDGRSPVADDLAPEVSARLMLETRGVPSPRRARAIAVAAVRETFEETGVVVGRPLDGVRAPPPGDGHGPAGFLPSLGRLRFVARAITPPGRPRRFDTRFFAAFAETIAAGLDAPAPSDELEGIGFVDFAEARADPALAPITRAVLDELERRLAVDPDLSADLPVPFYRCLRGRFARHELGGSPRG